MTMTFLPGFEIIDFEFPSDYEPTYPLRIDSKPTFSRAQFNETIEQVRSWGENQLAREFVVEYFLSIADANTVDDFLQTVTLYNKRFYWSAGDVVSIPIKVRCDSWNKELVSHNRAKIKATFIEVFDFSLRNVGVVATTPLTYLIGGQNAILSKGIGIETVPGNYTITVPDTNSLFARNLYADASDFSLSIIPAGPEIYYLDADNAAEYTIAGMDSDYNIGLAQAGDYFVSMTSQVYGWDRDFQVDWWGD